ncbi:hypothetical protein K458DRAFT_92078 [Lentithecium fluviatile CBS 122367]|uniref:Uncharacterized protein n=1 Tax=Lentithecium fluviatile CBS 122367 TaxID=1168545 RepID=A0A6G1IQJ9_9PLEO|nr:hypothetical protein K458DRAFT_92078 [Lentithecium fluviatile CBS 122367]
MRRAAIASATPGGAGTEMATTSGSPVRRVYGNCFHLLGGKRRAIGAGRPVAASSDLGGTRLREHAAPSRAAVTNGDESDDGELPCALEPGRWACPHVEQLPVPGRQLPHAKPGWWLAGKRAQVVQMEPFQIPGERLGIGPEAAREA